MIRWFIVADEFFHGRPGRPVPLEICLCDEREEGDRICADCFPQAMAWHEWMGQTIQ